MEKPSLQSPYTKVCYNKTKSITLMIHWMDHACYNTGLTNGII